MIELPNGNNLPINKLAGVFNDTTNSYKFYWFNAILSTLQKKNNEALLIQDLFNEMINDVWYPLDFYKLSFGKSDGFKKITQFINLSASIDNSATSRNLFDQIYDSFTREQLSELYKKVENLNRWVPYRFIRPFFFNETTRLPDQQVNKTIEALAYKASIENPSSCPYYFSKNRIILNELWAEYLKRNTGILKAFTFWHLTNFIQKNNPNTINISNKLFKPTERDLGKYRKSWDYYYNSRTDINCIYSKDPIVEKFSLDHFIPWSVVVHDLNWNLLPVSKAINSSKSDTLPDNSYIKPFIHLQYDFFQTITNNEKHKKVAEDYCLLFNGSVADIREMPPHVFQEKYLDVLSPMIQIAANMGFKTGWKYEK